VQQATRRGEVYSSNFHALGYNKIVIPAQYGATAGLEAAEIVATPIDCNRICENAASD